MWAGAKEDSSQQALVLSEKRTKSPAAVAHGHEESTATCCCLCLAHRPLPPLLLFLCVRLSLSRLCCSPPHKHAFLSRLLLSSPRSSLPALSLFSPCFLACASFGSFGARLAIQSSRPSGFAHSAGGFVESGRGTCRRQQHLWTYAAAHSVAAGTVVVVAPHTHTPTHSAHRLEQQRTTQHCVRFALHAVWFWGKQQNKQGEST
ncbi:hypothetical protein GQ54DRAFT_142807 [Martensiomyces pterosporus]|nr:hypothetical protein GQ54DRAFT_142807 [Martensiomyces pterosporus]